MESTPWVDTVYAVDGVPITVYVWRFSNLCGVRIYYQ